MFIEHNPERYQYVFDGKVFLLEELTREQLIQALCHSLEFIEKTGDYYDSISLSYNDFVKGIKTFV